MLAEENCMRQPDLWDSPALVQDARPVGGYATFWLHFLALCQRTESCGVKEKEEYGKVEGGKTDERRF